MTMNKAQQKALWNILLRKNPGAELPMFRGAYMRLRRQAVYNFTDCWMVPYCGMWLGIEKDGYTHS